MILSPLVHAQLSALAMAWQAVGASAFEVWAAGQLIERWPAGSTAEAPGLIAGCDLGRGEACHLRVAGVTGPAWQAHLAAEATLLARLAALEGEADGMTEALIEAQDQLLALYDLSRSMRSFLDVEQALRALAGEAARLVGTEGAIGVLMTPDAATQIAQFPAPAWDDAAQCLLYALFEQIKGKGSELLLKAADAPGTLPVGVRDLLLAPIQVRQATTAALGLWNKKQGEFASPDVKLVRAICQQAGAQIENVLLHQEMLVQARLQAEMRLARQVQVRLLPQSLPQAPGLDLWGESRPALQVGGDFYDFVQVGGEAYSKIQPGDRPLMLAVGDVAGKGMSAAMLMTMARTVVRSACRFTPSITPERVLARANEDLYDDLVDVGMFVTLFVAQYMPATRQLRYANAGHSPVLYRAAGGAARLLEADGTPLGVMSVSLCRDQTIAFRTGDVLIAATDGFSEAHRSDDELFGYDRLLRLVDDLAQQPAQQIARELYEAVNAFASGHEQDDDQTIVVIKGM